MHSDSRWVSSCSAAVLRTSTMQTLQRVLSTFYRNKSPKLRIRKHNSC